MFELDQQAAKLVHLNVREEKHGDDPVPAIDLKISADVPNTFLSQLHATLKWSLYDKAPTVDVVDDTHMPVLRYKMMEPIRWKGEMKEASIKIIGAEAAGNIDFIAAVNMLLLDCLEGGTVRISFRVQAVVDAFMVGQLAALLGQDIEITIVPPAKAIEKPEERKERTRARRKRNAGAADRNPTGSLLN